MAGFVSRPAVHGWSLQLALLGGAVVALLLLFARDAADMATIWWTSSTYEHCLVIVPILGWLVVQRDSTRPVGTARDV